MNSFTNRIPDAAVRRFSLYLRYLEDFERSGIRNVASGVLAERGGTTAAQVRKDLSFLGSFGKRGLGYSVAELTGVLRGVLGLDSVWRVALLGAGRIGTALFRYEPFRARGFHITTVIDNDPGKIGTRLGDVTIRGEHELESALQDDRTDLVIVAVPAAVAQALVDRVVAAGIRAVLNYAPTQLRLPGDVALRNVSMMVELESLSHALARLRR
ncbi:MAG: redox-sensing transcriptional repressor Rex [Gemmatimonadetes bacterium]|nr:redox-sensing transcriptional repressor Rex [Gemmatimonadota bacterium]MDE2677025.1 redox-sensing transcriptional repressor Rex [Gemmatimonadota bacterium]MXX35459.1 redox-sensing transcriptional repressor Rex [Gemmatimonadota bacterium]MYA12001.1 redox-sensing transcriptional repressor Rex [Gemmatimonadota bacterium]MYD12548.1 redox-sensing transcriptional repressor Rex [Gemmatimonadota bacterium]